jgi:hypothetical protein
MRYSKPQILTTLDASTHVKGVNPADGKGFINMVDSYNPIQKTEVAAYSSDE